MEKNENNKKDTILEFILGSDYRPLKFKEIAGLFQVPKEEREELRLLLEELLHEGKIELDDKSRYRRANANTRTGVFSGTGKGFGFVVTEEEAGDIFIPESEVNGARDQDTVRVSIKEGQRVSGGKRREGTITAILQRGLTEVVGTFNKAKEYGFVIPDNQKYGTDVYIAREHTKGAVSGHKVIAKITDFGNGKKNPEGRIVEILGHRNDPGVDILSIVKANGLPEAFPPEVMNSIILEQADVKDSDCLNRTDLTEWLTVTIDGEDAKDLDDAVTLTKDAEGNYELGVHIADVSHYVTEGSALDKEALNRGTSVYLVDRVIPMLPHQLSNGICSLNAGVKRLALSCIMNFNSHGDVTGHRIVESVLMVDRRMSYTKVNELLEKSKAGENDPEELDTYGDIYQKQFILMEELANLLREKRKKRGSLDFDLPESKIILDENGKPIKIQPYDRNAATKLIEDFMLVANETIAEEYFWQELPFVYRSHDVPDSERMLKLNTFINNFGYSIHLSSDDVHPKELQKLLSKIENTQEEALISRLTLRSMKQAKYTTTCDGHFGLAAKYYCHFTSPIRRYPDLQIHRIIKENIHGKLSEKRISHYESILPTVASQASRTERRADEAERQVEKLKKAEYMKQFIGEVFDGVISGVTGWGMYVELPNTIEGMIRVSDLTDDYYIFDEAHYMMVGEHLKMSYKLGQPIKIRVSAVDSVLHTIDFMPEE